MGFRKLRGFDKSSSEHRKNSRYPIDAEAFIVFGEFQTDEKTVDISAGGFSIRNPLPAELAGKSLNVTLRYSTSSGEVLTAKAKCRLVQKSLTRVEAYEPANAFQSFLEKIWG